MLLLKFINIFFIIIIATTSLPIKQAGNFFFKIDVQDEMQEDCCDSPIKKSNDVVGFKEYPCSYHHSVAVHPALPTSNAQLNHGDWRLPLWPAVEVHTPPP